MDWRNRLRYSNTKYILIGIVTLVLYSVMVIQEWDVTNTNNMEIPVNTQDVSFISGKERIMSSPATGSDSERRIVQSAEISFSQIADISLSQTYLQQCISSFKGSINSFHSSNVNNVPSLELNAEIPSSSFDDFLRILQEKGKGYGWKMMDLRMNSNDQSMQYIDTSLRIKILQTTLNKLEQLLTNASNVHESLQVHRELSNIQQQLEYSQSIRNHLDRQTSMSAITIRLNSEITKLTWPWNRLSLFLSIWNSLLFLMVDLCMIALVLVLPFWLFYFIFQRRETIF